MPLATYQEIPKQTVGEFYLPGGPNRRGPVPNHARTLRRVPQPAANRWNVSNSLRQASDWFKPSPPFGRCF